MEGKLLEEVRLQDSHVVQYLSTPMPLMYVQPAGQPAEPCATATLAEQARTKLCVSLMTMCCAMCPCVCMRLLLQGYCCCHALHAWFHDQTL